MNGKSLGAAAASENKRSRHICSRIKRLKNVMSTCNSAHQTTHQSQSTSDFLSKKKKTKERNVWLVAQLLLLLFLVSCCLYFFLFDDAYLCIHFFFFSYEDDFYFLYTHTLSSLSLSLFGLSRLIKSHIRRRLYSGS